MIKVGDRRSTNEQGSFIEPTLLDRKRERTPVRLSRLAKSAAMGVDAIVTVCTRELTHELREFLPSVRGAFGPDVPIYVYTDTTREERAPFLNPAWTDTVIFKKLSREKARKRVGNVLTISDYYDKEAIWWQLEGMREVMLKHPGAGVLMLDCDITFRQPIARKFHADVVLSPCFWGNLRLVVPENPTEANSRKVYLHERDGLFNAGMVLSRRLEFVEWWIDAYETGRFGGFYEQKCLEDAVTRFSVDSFGPQHNFGKWRFEAPAPSVKSYHMHVREVAQKRGDVVTLKLAAQRAAADWRRILMG